MHIFNSHSIFIIQKIDRVAGELKLAMVRQVTAMSQLRFAIAFEGKDSPWVLRASNEVIVTKFIVTLNLWISA